MPELQWLTKAEAAARIGVDERTIERAARRGRLGVQARPGFPSLYNPVDVEIEATARRTGVRPVVLAPGQAVAGNGHGAIAPAPADAGALAHVLVQLLHAVRQELLAGLDGPTGGPTGPTPPTYLTLGEALARSGLSVREFRAAVQAGEVKKRGRRFRRADVERL
jgi:hypothetical protein